MSANNPLDNPDAKTLKQSISELEDREVKLEVELESVRISRHKLEDQLRRLVVGLVVEPVVLSQDPSSHKPE